MRFAKFTRFSSLSIAGAVVLFFGLGLAVMSLQQQQDNRSRAAWTGGQCNLQGQSVYNCCSNPDHIRIRTGWTDVASTGSKCIDTTTESCGGRLVPSTIWLCPGGNNIRCCAAIVAPPPPPPASTATPTPTATRTPTPTATRTPTPTVTLTPTPGATRVSLDLLMHGIGKGGDSANPLGGGNTNLVHLQRQVTVEVFDAQNQPVADSEGVVVYNSTSGSFKGSVDLGTDINTGVYTIKVKLLQSLKTLVPGIQILTAGTLNALPQTTLINGDVNNDNAINIIDYDILLGCYSDFLPPENCTSEKKIMSDITDDGSVNQFDYNLFLRELSNVGGQ